MKPNELRIGNWVNHNGQATRITSIAMGIGGGYMGFLEDNPEHQYHDGEGSLETIPLTEEWLLKFGFAIKEVADYVSIDFTVYQKGKLLIDDSKNLEYDYSGLILGYELEYVHQLQNLYFVLTGEELTLK